MPLFFNADPINTGVNNLLIVALLIAAYISVLYIHCYHNDWTKLPLVLLLSVVYPRETFHQVYHPH